MDQAGRLDSVVVYQVQVRSFLDSNGDGIGDLPGLTSKLDYIHSLGVSTVYLNPITKARRPPPGAIPTKDQFNGYESVGLTEIDPDLGTAEDLARLVSEAHRLGLRIVLDFLTIGVSTHHPYFQDALARRDSPYRDHFLIAETPPPGPWLNFGGSPWTPLPGGGCYYALWLDFPFLNYRNPAIEDHMFSVADHWLGFGIDGFRLDAAKYLFQNGAGVERQEHQNETLDYWRRFRRRMAERFGAGKILIGEVLPYPRDVDYIGAMGEMLDFCFDGVFAEGLFSTDTICVEDLSHALLQGAFNEVSYAHNITYLSNHDRGRLAAKTRGYSHEKGKLMAALQFLSNGAPLLYYGDEVALVAADECPPHLRAVSAMAWDGSTQGGFTRGGASPLCPSRNAGGCNVEAQEAETASLLNYYRSLITFRRSQPAFQRAKRRELSSANPRLHAYCLYDESGVMLIVHNLAETPVNGSIGLPRPLRDEPARILFGEEAISCQAQGECLLVRRLDGYRSAALLFDSARAEAFAHRQEDSCITFPRMDAGPARILAAPDCGSWAASVATRESDAMVECFSVRRNQAECWHRIRAPGRERLLLPLPDDTRYVSVTGDADLDFVPLDWREHFAARTRLICESDRNHYLRRLQCGADEAFWHIHLTHDAVPPIPVGGGIDCVFLLIDSAAAPRVQRLAFWLLPEIAVSGPVDAIIICQRQAGENRAILYTDSSQSILPGVRRKDALISHYDETELFLMVNRSALPRSRYGLGAFVWSAAGRWLDAAGERGACREALPHLRPRDSRGAGSDLDTYVDLCA